MEFALNVYLVGVVVVSSGLSVDVIHQSVRALVEGREPPVVNFWDLEKRALLWPKFLWRPW